MWIWWLDDHARKGVNTCFVPKYAEIPRTVAIGRAGIEVLSDRKVTTTVIATPRIKTKKHDTPVERSIQDAFPERTSLKTQEKWNYETKTKTPNINK